MTKRGRILLGTASAALTIFEVIVLADKLGRLRWFWPYDSDLYSAAIVIGVVGATLLYGAMAPEWKEYQAKRDREDDEYK